MKTKTICLIACLLGGAAFGCAPHGPQSRRNASERLPRLEVVQPIRAAVVRRVELAASVEAYQRVDLSARVPGVVEHLPAYIDIGKKVTAGDVLLRLTVPDLEADKKQKEALLDQARKQEVQAKEAFTVAEREVTETQKDEKRYRADVAFQTARLARIRKLVRREAQDVALQEESERQLASAEAALDANRAKVATRKARVRSAMADQEVAGRRIGVAEAEVNKLTEMIGFATVRAPFDGVITRRWVDQGAIIKDPGATLLTVMQIDRVRVLVDVPQRDVPLINDDERRPNADGRGDPAEVRIPALAETSANGNFKGTITRTGQSLDPVTRTMRAEIVLDNKTGYLKPGMFGTASIVVETRPNRLTVPASALVRLGDEKVAVYCVTDAEEIPGGPSEQKRGVLRRIDIELGLDDGKRVEVRKGLKGDELIVVRGNSVLRVEDAVIAVPVE
jgi:RND family efflux transporter MFP subunit